MVEPFEYSLPEARIAQRPVQPYDHARLLVVNREASQLFDRHFHELPTFLRPRDLLVVNNTKVIPARLLGEFRSGGSLELLLLWSGIDEFTWVCLGRPMRKFTEGTVLKFDKGVTAIVLERVAEKELIVRFSEPRDRLLEMLGDIGTMPIPPYIRKGLGDESDRVDYQTPFGEVLGSVAAPTASLHFTDETRSAVKAMGAQTIPLTLHLGTASFLPLWKEGEAGPNPPSSEKLRLVRSVFDTVTETRANGGRIIAVGTSVVRALETMARLESTEWSEGWVDTDLFIQPGHEFKFVDGIITNFHQPRTTHLLLVEAFLGRELLSDSYEFALVSEYRFLSYGDAMFLT